MQKKEEPSNVSESSGESTNTVNSADKSACNECGQKITKGVWKILERPDLKFCSEDCAEAYFVKNVMEEKEECS